jgi:hypothetical protein
MLPVLLGRPCVDAGTVGMEEGASPRGQPGRVVGNMGHHVWLSVRDRVRGHAVSGQAGCPEAVHPLPVRAVRHC